MINSPEGNTGTILAPELNPSSIEEGRLAFVFEPLEPLHPPTEPSIEDYSYLLDPTNPLADNSVNAAAVRSKRTGELVTVQSESEALEELEKVIRIDSVLYKIISDYMSSANIGLDKIPSALRYTASLRLDVGKHLMNKISTNKDGMPRRVRDNKGKASNNALDYNKKLLSREVAAKIALSHLDGTWIKEREDETNYNKVSDEGSGQHRYAARILLTEPWKHE